MQSRAIFFGTHEFASVLLRNILTWNTCAVVAVVTQPDRPFGRKKILTPSHVKQTLLEYGYTGDIFTPVSLKKSEIVQTLTAYTADIFIVVEYGKIIPQTVLDIPTHGAVNIHPSLLPEYRGPAPIQQTLIDGKKVTGTTLMLLDNEMDHGPVLAQREVHIPPDATFPQLRDMLAHESATLLRDTLPLYLNGSLKPHVQNHARATYMRMIERQDGEVDWAMGAQNIYNRWRGLTPWPGIYSHLHSRQLGAQGKRCKLLEVAPTDIPSHSFTLGSLYADSSRLFVATTTTYLEVKRIQLEGKKPLNAAEFIRGLQ